MSLDKVLPMLVLTEGIAPYAEVPLAAAIGNNPPVSPAASQPPLHKGALSGARRERSPNRSVGTLQRKVGLDVFLVPGDSRVFPNSRLRQESGAALRRDLHGAKDAQT